MPRTRFSRQPCDSHVSTALWVGLLVEPSTRETFMPRELADAYEKFLASGPRYLDAQTGIEGSVYRFGTRVLVVYEEPETGLVVLIHPTS
jgi:hypothetical protein